MDNLKVIQYVDKAIGFYFDGGFEKMIVDAQLDNAEICGWLNMAVLYNQSIPRDLDDAHNDTAFSLIEALYVSGEVEVMTGGRLADVDLNEVGVGYEYDNKYFDPILRKAHQFLLLNGLDLSGYVRD